MANRRRPSAYHYHILLRESCEHTNQLFDLLVDEMHQYCDGCELRHDCWNDKFWNYTQALEHEEILCINRRRHETR